MGIRATQDAVLTSPQAAAEMLSDAHPADTVVLVVGAPWLAEAVRLAGLRPVRLAADNPAAVVQGHSPDTGWRDLAEACIALRTGADWVACNTDSTLPTDRGLLPGNGAMVAALIAATGLHPRVAGKPERPLLDAAVHRAGSTSPLVVGDRLDTDIEAGVSADLPSLLVLTGVSSVAELLAAPQSRRPTFVAFDLRGLVDPALSVGLDGGADTRGWRIVDGSLNAPAGLADGDLDDGLTLAALVALTAAAWSGTRRFTAADDGAQRVLTRLGLH
jgi:ribonucleotide monophosphatase NagD (HAD superfamily)